MPRTATTRGHDTEYWYTIFALLFLTGALIPLIYHVGGTRAASYTESNPLRLGIALVIYLIAAWLILRSKRAVLIELLQRNPLVIAVLFLPLASVLWSVDPEATFRRAAACTLTTVFCIYIAGRLSPEELLKRLMFVLLLGGVASVLYALAFPQYGMNTEGANLGSWSGVYGQKNELGRIASLAIIVAYFVRPSNQIERLYRYLTMAVFLFLLVMSQSRTNWFIMLGIAGFIPLLGVLRSKRLALSLRVIVVLSFGIGFILMVALGAEQLLSAVGRDDTFSGRQTLWRGVIAITNENFPILGAGYGAFFSEVGGVPELQLYYLTRWGSVPEHAHNGYLNVWADLGIVGLILLIVFLVTTSAYLLRRVIKEPDRPAWGAFSALMFFFLVNNMAGSVAFKHSDISWVLIVVASFYARASMHADLRHQVPRPVGLRYGAVPVWPVATTSPNDTRRI